MGGTSFATVFAWSSVRDQTANSSHHRHSLPFGCFCLVFFGAGTFPAVLGVSVLFRTRMRLFAPSVSTVVIWPNQIADTVDPPVVQNDFAAVFACSPVWDQTANSSHHRHRVRFGCFGSSFFGAGTFSCGFLVFRFCFGHVPLFAEVVTIVVIWVNQFADTVVSPLTQVFGNTRECNKEVQM